MNNWVSPDPVVQSKGWTSPDPVVEKIDPPDESIAGLPLSEHASMREEAKKALELNPNDEQAQKVLDYHDVLGLADVEPRPINSPKVELGETQPQGIAKMGEPVNFFDSYLKKVEPVAKLQAKAGIAQLFEDYTSKKLDIPEPLLKDLANKLYEGTTPVTSLKEFGKGISEIGIHDVVQGAKNLALGLAGTAKDYLANAYEKGKESPYPDLHFGLVKGVGQGLTDLSNWLLRGPMISSVNMLDYLLSQDPESSNARRADRLVESLKMDRAATSTFGTGPDVEAGRLIGQFAPLPGVGGLITRPSAKAADSIVNMAIKGAAKARLPQLAVRAGKAALYAGQFHPVKAVTEAIMGDVAGGSEWANKVKEVLFGKKAKTMDLFTALREAPAGVPAAEWIDASIGDEISRLKAKEQWFRDNFPDEIKKVDATIPGTDKPVFGIDELEGVDKDIRQTRLDVQSLEQKRAQNEVNGRVHRVLTDLAKAGVSRTLLSTALGTEFATLSAASSLNPEEAAKGGFGVGSTVGSALGLKEYGRSHSANLRSRVANIGKPLIEGSIEGLPKEHQDAIATVAANANAFGKKVYVLSPEELLKKDTDITGTQHSPGDVAPNGFENNGDLYLNKDAIGVGVGEHELTHLFEKQATSLFSTIGEDIKSKMGAGGYDDFFNIYDAAVRKTNPNWDGLSNEQKQSEVLAELGRIATRNTPLSEFYGGKSGAKIISDFFKQKFGKENTDLKIDPTLGLNYDPSQIQKIQDIFYKIGGRTKAFYESGGKEKLSPAKFGGEEPSGQEKPPTEAPESSTATPEASLRDYLNQKPGGLMPATKKANDLYRSLTREEVDGIKAAIDRGEIKNQKQLDQWVKDRVEPRSGVLGAVKSLQDSERPFEITFQKTDGSLRTMKAQFGGGKEGAKRSADGKPHLYVVKDLESDSPRTFDIDKVTRIKGPGVDYTKPHYMPRDQGYWMDPNGELHRVQDGEHDTDAYDYILSKKEQDRIDKKYPDHDVEDSVDQEEHRGTIFDLAYKKGWQDIHIDRDRKMVFVRNNKFSSLKKAQQEALKDLAIDKGLAIAEDWWEKNPKVLFDGRPPGEAEAGHLMPTTDLEMPYAPDGAQKAWVAPDGEFIPIQYAHGEWFASHPEESKRLGITDPESMDDSSEKKAIASDAGFARITIPRGTGTAIVETSADKWNNIKNHVQDVLLSNADNIIRADIRLLDGQKVVSRDTEQINRDPSKISGMDVFAGEKPQGGSTLLERRGLSGLAVYGGENQLMPTTEPTVNIGLNTNDGKGISPNEAISALEGIGVKVLKSSVKQSASEPTLIATLDRPLTPEEGDKISRALNQEAIAQSHDMTGELYGPGASKWGPFNGDYYLNHSNFETVNRMPAHLPDIDEQDMLRQIRGLNNRLQGLVRTPGTPEADRVLQAKLELWDKVHKLREGKPRDIVVVGGGPAGLNAAINASYEGGDVVVLEHKVRFGGQPKDSSRIENVYGTGKFGITGPDITGNAIDEARSNGAQLRAGVGMAKMEYDPETGLKKITLTNGETILARNVVLAPGIKFRELNVPGKEYIINGNGRAFSQQARNGSGIVIGGGNSASQAALGAVEAGGVNHVYLLSRSPLKKGMSASQREQVRVHPQITVLHDEVAKVEPVDGKLLVTTKGGQQLHVNSIASFAGGKPDLSALPDELKVALNEQEVGDLGKNRDKSAKIEVNRSLETNIPGVYAAGDARAGGLARIGVAAADGQLAVANIMRKLGNKAQNPTGVQTEKGDIWNKVIQSGETDLIPQKTSPNLQEPLRRTGEEAPQIPTTELTSSSSALMPKASDQQIREALSQEKKDKVGAHRNLPEGSQVGVRIDIPAYNRTGLYAQTVHQVNGNGGIGKVLGYDHTVSLNNPVFSVNEAGAEKIHGGASKFPIATVNGEYTKDVPEGYQDWTKAGFNPAYHSYFYDKSTGEPILGGTRAVSTGNTVYVENPRYGQKQDFRFMPSSRPDAIKEAALRDEKTGEMFTGPSHPHAYEKAMEKYPALRDNPEGPWRDRFENGWVTNSGEFLNRFEAAQRARDIGQMPVGSMVSIPRYNDQSGVMESSPVLGHDRFDRFRNFMPSGDLTPNVNSEPWEHRLIELMNKERAGSLTPKEEMEIDRLHQQANQKYGSIDKFALSHGGSQYNKDNLFSDLSPNSEKRIGPFMPFDDQRNFMPFHSALEQQIQEKLPDRATADQVRGILKGVKKAEVEWNSPLRDLLDSAGDRKLAKQEVLDAARLGTPKIKEVIKRGGGGSIESRQAAEEALYDRLDATALSPREISGFLQRAKDDALTESEERMVDDLGLHGMVDNLKTGGTAEYGRYQLPGGKNYREILLTLPNAHDQFRSKHFDEPNIALHLRVNDRTTTDGKSMLFAEELQSDWAQKGRKEGFELKKYYISRKIGSDAPVVTDAKMYTEEEAKKALSLMDPTGKDYEIRPWAAQGVPNMPFKGEEWKRLGLRTLIQKAVESGKDAIGWTTGKQQSERYDLSKQVSKQKAGGEGMKGFYDKELVNIANDIGKKYGAKVQDAEIDIGEPDHIKQALGPNKDAVVHILPITDALREAVQKEGQPLFMPPSEGQGLDDYFFKEVWPKVMKGRSSGNLKTAARQAVEDVRKFITESPQYADYYNKDLDRTKEIMESHYGRPISDTEFKEYQLFHGLASPNTMLPAETSDAVQAWEHYQKYGNFDDVKVEPKPSTGNLILKSSPFQISGTAGHIKARAYKAFDQLAKEMGPGKAIAFLQEPVTAKELQAFNRQMGYKSLTKLGYIRQIVKNATGQSEKIPRMFIFGPKVGAYTMNLLGNHNYTTIDKWESRFVRSYLKGGFNNGIDYPEGKDEQKLFNDFSAAFNKRFREITGEHWDTSALQAARWFYILDATRKAGYNKSTTNDTISNYTKAYLNRRGNPLGGGAGDSGRSLRAPQAEAEIAP